MGPRVLHLAAAQGASEARTETYRNVRRGSTGAGDAGLRQESHEQQAQLADATMQKPWRILAVGGGSGGHVTPAAAVLEEVRRQEKGSVELRFWCDRTFAPQARRIMEQVSDDLPVEVIVSGKLRRYHGVSLFKQLVDIPTLLQNIRDTFAVGIGFVQSVFKLLAWRPDVVFTKGGFVCLPVGMAARLLKIPLVIHDSDAHPGLTNRILAKWADRIATGAPLENYPYPQEKTLYVGIPIARNFHPFSKDEKREAKAELGLPDLRRPLVVVTGGGLGAKRINDAMVAIGDRLLKKAAVVHISGKLQYEELKHKVPQSVEYQLLPFIDNARMAMILGAADVVVTRAGATTLLELAAIGAPTVIVPNKMLTGNHQTKNAKVYEAADAAVVIDEELLSDHPQRLEQGIVALIDDEAWRNKIGKRMHAFAKPHATTEVAQMITEVAKEGRGED